MSKLPNIKAGGEETPNIKRFWNAVCRKRQTQEVLTVDVACGNC